MKDRREKKRLNARTPVSLVLLVRVLEGVANHVLAGAVDHGPQHVHEGLVDGVAVHASNILETAGGEDFFSNDTIKGK